MCLSSRHGLLFLFLRTSESAISQKQCGRASRSDMISRRQLSFKPSCKTLALERGEIGSSFSVQDFCRHHEGCHFGQQHSLSVVEDSFQRFSSFFVQCAAGCRAGITAARAHASVGCMLCWSLRMQSPRPTRGLQSDAHRSRPVLQSAARSDLLFSAHGSQVVAPQLAFSDSRATARAA